MPLLLRDIVEAAIATEPRMRIVGVVGSPADLAGATIAGDPHVIVVGLDASGLPAECRTILERGVCPVIIGIDASDGRAYVFRRREEQSIGEVSPGELVAAVRHAASDLP
jgi:hypothetical protein